MRILSSMVPALALALVLLLGPAVPVGAQSPPPLDRVIERLVADSFGDTDAAIGDLAVSGHPLAADMVAAVTDGRLLFDAGAKRVVLKKPDGTAVDVATGAAVTDLSALKPVRLNNRVRRAIEAATGALTLLAPDPAKRRAAAEAVFRSRDEAALPALQAALAKEQDPAIAKAFREARAAILVAKADASEADRLAAVETLAGRTGQDALAVLAALPATTPESVKAAAGRAIAAIEREIAILGAIQNVFFGISLGSVLLLAAIGLAITFGVMGVINMAHGEMVMIGAYTTFVVQEVIRASAPQLFDASLFIALPLAFLVTGAIGVALERGIIRFLYGRPLETLLATWGVSLILQQAVRTWFGPTNREVGNPSFMSGSFELFGIALTWNRFWIVIFAMIVFAVLLFVLRYTSFGLRMRAVVQNRRMASSMGIRTNWIDAMTFGLGSGIAGIAGVALSQIDNVSPNLGQGYIIDSFMVVVFGGVGNLWGTLVAALTLGIANKFLEPFAGAVLAKILVLVFIILFIQKRPRGLFALKGRAVEQ